MEWNVPDLSELNGDFKFAYIPSNLFYTRPCDPESISGNSSGDKSLSADLAPDQNFTASSFFIGPANRRAHNSFYNTITSKN